MHTIDLTAFIVSLIKLLVSAQSSMCVFTHVQLYTESCCPLAVTLLSLKHNSRWAGDLAPFAMLVHTVTAGIPCLSLNSASKNGMDWRSLYH